MKRFERPWVGARVRILVDESADNAAEVDDNDLLRSWPVPAGTWGTVVEVLCGHEPVIQWDEPIGGTSYFTCPVDVLPTVIDIQKENT